MSDIAKELKKLNKMWKETEPQELGSRTVFPDGAYQIELKDMSVELSKSSSRLQIVYEMSVIEPDKYADKSMFKYTGLDNEVSLGWGKAELELLGIDLPDDFSEIPEALEDYMENHSGIILNVNVKNQDGYSNVYFASLEQSKTKSKSKSKDKDKDKDKDKSKDKDKNKGKKKSDLDPEEIRSMNRKELKKIIRNKDVDLDPEDYDDDEELAEAIISELDLE